MEKNAIVRLEERGAKMYDKHQAGRWASQFREKGYERHQYENLIRDIWDLDVDTTSDIEATLLFGYMVQITSERYMAQLPYEPDTILAEAWDRVDVYFKGNKWAHPSYQSQFNEPAERGQQEEGSMEIVPGVKPKKGAKQAKSDELYRSNLGLSNKEMVQLFMKELQMTKAGATTYVYNAKKRYQEEQKG